MKCFRQQKKFTKYKSVSNIYCPYHRLENVQDDTLRHATEHEYHKSIQESNLRVQLGSFVQDNNEGEMSISSTLCFFNCSRSFPVLDLTSGPPD